MRVLMIAFLVGLATPALADLEKVQDQSEFMELVAGKTLTRPFVELALSENGEIEGWGLSWAVTGRWSWQGGYFCRDLVWGGDSLGYNCQEVTSNGERIRFTSDKGAGDSAAFRLK